MIMYFILNNKIVFPIIGFNFFEQQIIALFVIELLSCLILFIIGTYYAAIYIKDMENKDPSEVVIDEVVGQMLTIILSSFSVMLIYGSPIHKYLASAHIDILFLFVLPFILFRLFDIFKPWPINWFDQNIKGALGIMVDDVAAAIFASIAQYILIFFLLDKV